MGTTHIKQCTANMVSPLSKFFLVFNFTRTVFKLATRMIFGK